MTRAALTAVVAGTLALSGCAGAAGSETDDPAVGTITVFAASSLTEAFTELGALFEAEHAGADVVLNFGGSGALATQIVQGAPADVFAAASEEPMATVISAGDAAGSTIFATNTLEIAVPAGNSAGVDGLGDLADPALAIALCDPSVPCGAAAADLLRAAGVDVAPDTLEQDVKGVLTKVELGEADAGLVYTTDVIAAGDRVEGIVVAESSGVINRYPIAVLTGSRNPDAARAWRDFVLSENGRAALAAAGFVAP